MGQSDPAAPDRRIPSLDGLRAVSIGLVLANHWLYDGRGDDPYNLGNLGVRVFFVISGFLITGLLLREDDRAGAVDLGRFYFRRTLRIAPAFYAYLAVMIGLAAAGWAAFDPRAVWPAFLYLSDYVSPLERGGFVATHTWSLSVEEQFYLLWPGLLVLAGRRRAVWVLAAAVLVSPVLRLVHYQYVPPAAGYERNLVFMFHTNLDSIGAGCLLAFLRPALHAHRAYARLLGSRLFVFVPAAVFWMNALQEDRPRLYYVALLSFVNLGVVLCLDWALTYPHAAVGRFLNWRPVTAVGALSYSLYLWQQPFLHMHGAAPTFYPSPVTNFLGDGVVCLLATVACAAASFYLIERPCLRLRGWLEARLFASDPGSRRVGPRAVAECGRGAESLEPSTAWG